MRNESKGRKNDYAWLISLPRAMTEHTPSPAPTRKMDRRKVWLYIEHMPAQPRQRAGDVMKAVGHAVPWMSGEDHCASFIHGGALKRDPRSLLGS
jgi:hypothetical protein